MNTTPQHDREKLTRQLDRLVDGELSPAEYRELLATLDTLPEGWKQCSLAFLEAQAWRQDLRDLVAHHAPPATAVQPATAEPAKVEQTEINHAQPTAPSRITFPWTQLFSLAASLLLAFLIGRNSISPLVGENPTTPKLVHESFPSDPHTESIATIPQRPIPTGQLSLLVNGRHAEPQRRELPVVEAAQLEPQMLSPLDDLSSEMEAAFRRAGLRVERRQQFVPLPLDDQRAMLVPMHRVHVEPKQLPVY